MDYYEYDKYVTNKNNLKQTLEQYGVAIIPHVLNKQECQTMLDGMWQSFEHITQQWEKPIQKNNYDSFKLLYPLHNQLYQRYTLTHSQYYWDIRQNEKIVDLFSTLWEVNNEDLLVSFDGLSFCLPPEITKRGWHHKDWLHTDQSFTNNQLTSIQSWVTALDINKGDATLTFLEKSHLYHEQFSKHFKITDKSDWYKLNEKELDFYKQLGCEKKAISCPAGSMVFWDSRTIHAGQNPIKGREHAHTRCIVYLCYTPRIKSTPSQLKKKQKAFEELRTTNHCPHKPKLFPVHPRTYGQPLPVITPVSQPLLSPLGKRLAGY
jgi:hypothetical protein